MKNKFLDISIRYLFLVLIALPNLFIFYFIFKPLTLYPVFWLLNIFYDASLLNFGEIFVNGNVIIELINACIAGSAYYLLLILNLSTPEIPGKQRIKMILFSFSSFLIVNIARILVLAAIAISGSSFFDITHKLFWYSLSTIFVVAIWFTQVKIFRIKEMPFYSDIKFLYNIIKKDRR